MKAFMDKNFLLSTETAQHLFHDYAKAMPIIDYHCHINPQEIYENRKFKNITEIWLGGDHYKWRQMRSNGVDEQYITGSAPDKEKFIKWAQTLEKAIGNPLYHWSHMELARYFDYKKPLSSKTAEEVWAITQEKLKQEDMGVRELITKSGVEVICTTDDPADTLEWHKKIKEDESFHVAVLPAWRPDKAMNIEKPDFTEYLQKLEKVSGLTIQSFKDLKQALLNRMDFFEQNGCRLSDHALEYVMYQPVSEAAIEAIFAKRLAGESVSKEEEQQYKTAFMLEMAQEYDRRGWVMQLHYGCKRDNNTFMYEQLGPDTGYDCINSGASSAQMADFFNAMNAKGSIPKTILYSLDPNDNAVIGTLIGCFQGDVPGKIQQGSAWWFNDHKTGMMAQMTSLANLGLLGNFIGMLTDSRSFLSYARHEYFRRILCELIGGWVENGEYPNDEDALKTIIQGISYTNAKNYFGFN